METLPVITPLTLILSCLFTFVGGIGVGIAIIALRELHHISKKLK